jgi:hypothetical protein
MNYKNMVSAEKFKAVPSSVYQRASGSAQKTNLSSVAKLVGNKGSPGMIGSKVTSKYTGK